MTGMTDSNSLLSPFDLGGLRLKNRVVLSPMTRGRAGAERKANALMAEYYRQRASAGFSLPKGRTFRIRRSGG